MTPRTVATIEHDEVEVSDPAALNAAVDRAMAAAAEPEPDFDYDEKAEELPETSVTLAGGFVTEDMEIVYDVEVRELTGLDEEAIAKAPSVGRALQVILERGTVTIGGTKATRDMLDTMLLGDRDLVLIGIRRATYGDALEYQSACPSCGEVQEFSVSLAKDVKVKRLENPGDRYFAVDCRVGEVEVALPDGKTHRELLNATDHSVAEMTTLLLAGCVQSIDGAPALGTKSAQKLGIRDRKTLSEEIARRSPGPEWGAVSRRCSECDGEIVLDVTLAALFRF